VCVCVCLRVRERERFFSFGADVSKREERRKEGRETGRESNQVLAGHAIHKSAVAPTVDEYLPPGQSLQSAEPMAVLNLPATHAVQVLPLPSAPSGPVYPALHGHTPATIPV